MCRSRRRSKPFRAGDRDLRTWWRRWRGEEIWQQQQRIGEGKDVPSWERGIPYSMNVTGAAPERYTLRGRVCSEFVTGCPLKCGRSVSKTSHFGKQLSRSRGAERSRYKSGAL